MGIKDTAEEKRNPPVVHPVLKVSEDHFKKNTAYVDGRYRVLEEQSKFYKNAPKVDFNDLVGLALSSVYIFILRKHVSIFQKSNFFILLLLKE